MKKIYLFFILVFAAVNAFAECVQKENWKLSSLLGPVSTYYCGKASNDPQEYRIGNDLLYRASYPFMYEWSKKTSDRNVVFYIFSTGDLDKKTRCSDRMVLLDFSGDKPRAFNFGVRGSCHEFKSAFFRDGGVVIKLKNNLIFSYKNGVFKLPKKVPLLFEEGLFNSPWYSPVSMDELFPYAEEYKVK